MHVVRGDMEEGQCKGARQETYMSRQRVVRQGVESECVCSAIAAANANFYRSTEAKLWACGLVAVASWATSRLS